MAETLFNHLLRRYTGIFQEFVFIDEEEISLSTGLTVKDIYETLVALSQRRIIRYIPRKRIPYLTLTRPRVEGKDIFIPSHVYEERYKRQKERIDSVIDYFCDNSSCRTAQLLAYFGEDFNHRCNNCDNCDALRPKHVPESIYDTIEQDIRNQLSSGPQYAFNLNLSQYSPTDIENVIRTLTENGELIQEGLKLKIR
jgi:ATP-dependent DNA helicase RecQ